MKDPKLLLLAAALYAALPASARSPFPDPGEDGGPTSCTSITVGKKASADGSVITSHTCDSYMSKGKWILYRTWADIVPAARHEKGATAKIYKDRLFAGRKDDTHPVLGEIPQADSTYAYLNTAYPCLNEKQLGIGETSIDGRDTLRNGKGMFYVEELERIALERCSTARDAIRLIGALIRDYGYADNGECLTIADKHEVWQMEMYGEGPDKVGGVWAAVRIPDDHVGVSANIPRIGTLDLTDPDRYMASENVFEVARKMGFWDGKKPFRFWEAYNGERPFSIREYFVLSTLAPSLGLTYDLEELPFTVKPDKKVSVRDVMALLRSYYEGTEWDPTRNLKIERKRPDGKGTERVTSPYANPWMNREKMAMLNAVRDSTVVRYRTIAMPECTYSHVIQLRDWLPDEVGGIAWLSLDNPAQSPRIPVFAGTLSLPPEYDLCGQLEFNPKAALWPYRRANKLATVKWGETRGLIEGAVKEFEDRGFDELDFVDGYAVRLLKEKGRQPCREFLTRYTRDFSNAALKRWWELGDRLWVLEGKAF